MKICIIGASAGLGLETVKQALNRGHEVITLSRSEIPLHDHPHLFPIMGSATDPIDLKKALQHSEAVIVTLGTSKNMKATTLFSDFAKNLLEVQKGNNENIPHIMVTGFGAGESLQFAGWFVKLFVRYFLKDVYADKSNLEEIITASTLDWIIVRPGRLMDGRLTEKYRVETELRKGIKIGSINRSDLADYLVKQAENPTELGQFVTVDNN